MKRIILPVDTPSFLRVDESGDKLVPSGQVVPAGTELVVSEPLIMTGDHCNQPAVYFKEGGKKFFLIVREMGVELARTQP